MGLIACDGQYNSDDPIRDHGLREDIASQIQEQKMQTASQISLPTRHQLHHAQISEQAKAYVGRYQAVISCEDDFAQCDTGTADFILNLLEDGTAHRSMIHLGEMTFNSADQYRQDQWSYDEQQHQIVLRRGSGEVFFYHIGKDGSMTMDLARITHATAKNRAYFAAGYALPAKAYTLVKVE